MMTSSICQEFVQNTWRKDLCSNCFKSKNEHDNKCFAESKDSFLGHRYCNQTTTVFQSPNFGARWLPSKNASLDSTSPFDSRRAGMQAKLSSSNSARHLKESISCFVQKVSADASSNGFTTGHALNSSKTDMHVSKVPNGEKEVRFNDAEPEVIGYGGDDIYSEEDCADDVAFESEEEFLVSSVLIEKQIPLQISAENSSVHGVKQSANDAREEDKYDSIENFRKPLAKRRSPIRIKVNPVTPFIKSNEISAINPKNELERFSPLTTTSEMQGTHEGNTSQYTSSKIAASNMTNIIPASNHSSVDSSFLSSFAPGKNHKLSVEQDKILDRKSKETFEQNEENKKDQVSKSDSVYESSKPVPISNNKQKSGVKMYSVSCPDGLHTPFIENSKSFLGLSSNSIHFDDSDNEECSPQSKGVQHCEELKSKGDKFRNHAKGNRLTSLKRILMGSRFNAKVERPPLPPRIKPEIVHPTDLSGGNVQVISKNSFQPADSPHASTTIFSPASIKTSSPISQKTYPNGATNLSNAICRSQTPKHNLPEKMQSANNHSSKPPASSEYANLGDVRSSLVPRKPERGPSLREVHNREFQKRRAPQPFVEQKIKDRYGMTTHLWKNFAWRSRSLPSTLTELHSYTSNVVHQSLTYVLDIISQLRSNFSEKESSVEKLELAAFSLTRSNFVINLNGRSFFDVVWSQKPAVLMLSSEPVTIVTAGNNNYDCNVLKTCFRDFASADLLQSDLSVQIHVPVFVTLMHAAKMFPLLDYCSNIEFKSEESYLHLAFILLQLVCLLKVAQAQGIEKLNSTLQDLILIFEDHDNGPLVLLVLDDPPRSSPLCHLTLCECVLAVLNIVADNLPSFFSLLTRVLQEERSGSLTRTKLLLELFMWGPDMKDTSVCIENWLDSARADALEASLCPPNLYLKRWNMLDELFLLFLVRTNANSIQETIRLDAT